MLRDKLELCEQYNNEADAAVRGTTQCWMEWPEYERLRMCIPVGKRYVKTKGIYNPKEVYK